MMPTVQANVLCCVACTVATIGSADDVRIGYTGGIAELMLLDPEAAAFECGYESQPAQVEVISDHRTPILADFVSVPTATATPSNETTTVVVRRGAELTLEEAASSRPAVQLPQENSLLLLQSSGLPEDWSVQLQASLDVCVGLASIEVVNLHLSLAQQVDDYTSDMRATIPYPSDGMTGDTDVSTTALYGNMVYPIVMFSLIGMNLEQETGTNSYSYDRRLGTFTIFSTLLDGVYEHQSDGTLIHAEVQVILFFDLVTGAAPSEPIYGPL